MCALSILCPALLIFFDERDIGCSGRTRIRVYVERMALSVLFAECVDSLIVRKGVTIDSDGKKVSFRIATMEVYGRIILIQRRLFKSSFHNHCVVVKYRVGPPPPPPRLCFARAKRIAKRIFASRFDVRWLERFLLGNWMSQPRLWSILRCFRLSTRCTRFCSFPARTRSIEIVNQK